MQLAVGPDSVGTAAPLLVGSLGLRACFPLSLNWLSGHCEDRDPDVPGSSRDTNILNKCE